MHTEANGFGLSGVEFISSLVREIGRIQVQDVGCESRQQLRSDRADVDARLEWKVSFPLFISNPSRIIFSLQAMSSVQTNGKSTAPAKGKGAAGSGAAGKGKTGGKDQKPTNAVAAKANGREPAAAPPGDAVLELVTYSSSSKPDRELYNAEQDGIKAQLAAKQGQLVSVFIRLGYCSSLLCIPVSMRKRINSSKRLQTRLAKDQWLKNARHCEPSKAKSEPRLLASRTSGTFLSIKPKHFRKVFRKRYSENQHRSLLKHLTIT